MTTVTSGVVALALVTLAATAQQSETAKDTTRDEDRRPRLVVKATPSVALTPARVRFTGEAIGGADDFQDFYCAAVRWDWGDDTSSESDTDCPPYEPGVSKIKRRFTADHTYRRPGSYRVTLHLRQRSRQIATGVVTVQIRAGARDF